MNSDYQIPVKTAEIDGLTITYTDTGDRNLPPVVLMHGWGCDHSTVRSIAAALEDRMRVINVDLPGHGQSSEPPTVWGVDNYTRFMESFIDSLGLVRPALIGHSFGGRISILMASRRDVSKVVLVDAAGVKPRRSWKYYAKIWPFKATRIILPKLIGHRLADPVIEAWRSRRGSADYRNASPVMRAVLSKCVNEDLKHVMPAIKAPTLLVWGTEDTATPLSDAKVMEKLIPDAGLVAFDGCGHYSFLDNPRGFKAVIREFFKPAKS